MRFSPYLLCFSAFAVASAAHAQALQPGQETCKQRKLDKTCLGPCMDKFDTSGRFLGSRCAEGFTATIKDNDIIIRNPSPTMTKKIIEDLKAPQP